MLKIRTFVIFAFFTGLTVTMAGRLFLKTEVDGQPAAPVAIDWSVFSSEAGNFTVMFPGVPSEGVSLGVGKAPEEQIFTFRQSEDTSGYVLAYEALTKDTALVDCHCKTQARYFTPPVIARIESCLMC